MQGHLNISWAAVFPSTLGELLRNFQAKKGMGNSRDILLQGFHWHAHNGTGHKRGKSKSWYRILSDNAPAIKAAGFTWVWFPPPSDSLACEGYLPRRWDVLDTAYGTAAEL